MWTSNENLPKVKVVDLKKLHKFDIQHFFVWAPEKRENLIYREVPKILEIKFRKKRSNNGQTTQMEHGMLE